MASERIRRQVEHLLDQAEEAISRLDWDAASRFSRAALALEPENADAAALGEAARRSMATPNTAQTTVPSGPPAAEGAPAGPAVEPSQAAEALSPAPNGPPGGEGRPAAVPRAEAGPRVLPAVFPQPDQGLTPAALLQEVPPAQEEPASRVFVGRGRELAELHRCLEDALAGRGRLVMLVGESGIGKTRTAQELAAHAGERGARVLWGRCHEEKGMPPYWPWVQALRTYIREQDPARLRVEMGSGAVDIAEMMPEVREQLPGLQPPPDLEPDQARFRLFDSITNFLKAAARRQPLVIILDNLHWADSSSLLVLEFLSQELTSSPILLLGTYRDGELSRRHPLSQILGELSKDRLFLRLRLRGLSREDVGRFLQLGVGTLPPQGLVEAVYRQTEGNPLFVMEVVRLLVQEEALTAAVDQGQQDWSLRIPEGVREVIGRRLDRLSEPCNHALTAASVLGREFALDQLAGLLEDPPDDALLEVLEEALAAGVVEELPQSLGRYQFSHTMVQQTLLGELSTPRRARLHAQCAQVLERLYGSQAEAHASEIIFHLVESAGLHGTGQLVQYSLVAGERALRAYAWEEALAYFRQALAVTEDREAGLETARLLFGLARAQAATAEGPRIQEAVAHLQGAFRLFAAAGDVAGAVGVAAYPLPALSGHSTGMASLIAAALALVPPDSHDAGRLLASYVRVLMVEEGDYEAAQAAYNRALRIARREGDESLELRVLASATSGDAQYLRLQGTLAKSLRGIELAHREADPRTEVDVRLSAALSLWWMGELTDLERQAQEALDPAERLRDRYWLTGALWLNEVACSLEGRWGLARELSERCLQVSPRDHRPRSTRALLESTLGDQTQAQAHLERLLEFRGSRDAPGMSVQASIALTLPLLARTSGSPQGLDTAQEAARAVLSAPVVIPCYAMMARAGLGLVAHLRGDASSALAQYEAIRSRSALRVPESFMPFVRLVPYSFISTSRLLGFLAQAAGKPEQAAEHFEDALAACRRSGWGPELAWTCRDYAAALIQWGRAGLGEDPQRAGALLEESAALARRMEMAPLLQQAEALVEALPPAADARVPYPDGLTRREVEVLRLIASGRSNQDIAAELVISLRTVANHVTSILNKIGASNRTEAAIYATRQGLT